MTPVRWLYEYIGLLEKDREYWTRIRRLIVSLLGLNMIPPSRIKDETVEAADQVMPLAVFLNQGMGEQLMKEYIEDLQVEKFSGPDADDSWDTDLEIVGMMGKSPIKTEEAENSFEFVKPQVLARKKIVVR